MVDLHTAELSTITHRDAIAWIEASAIETQRVDFKETSSSKLDGIVET
jgi:arsenate reductase-like glutaredoxin family protein